MPLTFNEKLLALEANAQTINDVVNGDISTTVTTESGQVIKSLAKFFLDLENTNKKSIGILGNISGTVDLDVSEFYYYYGTLSGSTTFTFSGLPLTDLFLSLDIYLKQDNVGQRTFSFPNSVKWDGGIVPNPPLSIGSNYLYNFVSYDRGVTWLGCLMGYDFS